ncbi:MAG: alpha/beta hydrolase [Solidesulfovibrio sp. DCME]|uniref:alpha/beta hydrolase n=1 Tax=Solidesulfovibrio sp. DCME TaxID=3447380 RepID=UPI003D0BFA95
MRLRIGSVFSGLLGLAAVGYVAVCAQLYLTQDAQVFPAPSPDPIRAEEVAKAHPALAGLHLTTPDGTVLSGLLMSRERDGAAAPLLLYFGGNQDLCQDFFVNAPEELPDMSLACLDYRGYGSSHGKPSEALVKADALFAFDFLSKQTNAPSVTVMGRSLGTALATHVAALRPSRGLILVTPAESIAAVGQERYPYIPVGLLLRSHFDMTPDAARVLCPTLVFIAASDTTIPPHHGQRLASFLSGQKRIIVLEGDHTTILQNSGYWPAIREFQAGLEQ